MEIVRGIIRKPLRVVIYGPEGIGKTTFASQFPAPLFIDTENSSESIDVARFKKPTSWTMLWEQVKTARSMIGEYQTLALDTADWAEILCKNHVCAKANLNGIEDFGYGKGYIYLAEEFGRLLNLLSDVRDAGMNIVVTAHAAMRKFEQPDEMGSYDRWELKLEKKTAPLLKEWADMMLFANYETFVVKENEKSAKGKAQGGRRVMYATHHPCWDAKNRQGLPDKMPFDYQQIAHCIPDMRNPISTVTGFSATEKADIGIPTSEQAMDQTINRVDFDTVKNEKPTVPFTINDSPADLEGVPGALADLMRVHGITVEQIQNVVASRGYYPATTPISNYDPDFVAGVLVGAWDQVFMMIKENEK